MRINLDTNDIVLEDEERQQILACGYLPMEVLQQLVGMYSANFTEDLKSVIEGLEANAA